MQNLVTLFGSAGATRFLQLVASPYRIPAYELLALNEDGSTRLDLTDFFISFSSTPTDEVKAVSATFVIANPGGRFDRYAGADSDVLADGHTLKFRRGLKDPVDGTLYLLPAFHGRIGRADANYTPTGPMDITVSVMDELKNPVKQRVTSHAYQNTQANLIASNLLQSWGKFLAGRIKLADLDRVYPWALFPDMLLIDCLKILFDPVLYFVRADENGDIVTAPRLGSAQSGFADIKGFPDQLTPPPPEAIAYTFPDSPGVETIAPTWQDMEGVYNQVRVLGQATAAKEALGPSQLLHQQQNTSIGRSDKLNPKFSFSNPAGTQNSVIARNVYVFLEYSTDHELDEDPRSAVLSLMTWRGAWSADEVYRAGDAVSLAGNNYACFQGADSSHPPTDIEYWQEIPVAGPFLRELYIDNLTDDEPVGYVAIQSVTEGEIVLKIEGRGFSRGGGLSPVRHRGGFDYRFSILGQPVLSFDRTTVAYADYNVQTVTGQALTDPFGDGRTYQSPHAPFAMSVPVEVFKDGDSLGKISADHTELSGETAFEVDFERGRIVLKDLAYRAFEKDRDGSGNHPYSTGGVEGSTLQDFNPGQLETAAPEELYQSYRKQDSVYTFPGLVVGQGYDIRLHFADPSSDQENRRKFSVFANGNRVLEGLDIVAATGGKFFAHQEVVTGVAPNSSGEIVLHITQHDPASGALLPECSKDGEGEEALGEAIICGIEILLPQGQGADPYAVNCGGDAIAADVPDITANYGYSPVQQIHGIQVYEINDPLIASYAECYQVAGWWANYLAWQRHQQTVRAPGSVPHLQPGDLVKWYNPVLDADFVGYVWQIGRSMTQGGTDSDALGVYLIYVAPRS